MGALIHSHSGLRWVALALLVFAIVNAILKLKSGKYEKGDKMLNLFAMVMLHIQITLGIIVSFVSGKILQFKPFMIGGIVSWCLAVTAIWFPFSYQSLFGAAALLSSYIIPGHLFRGVERKLSL